MKKQKIAEKLDLKKWSYKNGKRGIIFQPVRNVETWQPHINTN